MKYFAKTNDSNFYDGTKTLTQLANELQTDKGTAKELSWSKDWPEHTTMEYTLTYEKYMNTFRNTPVKLFEVGICDKRFPFASQKMWLSYFKNVECYGMDNFWGHYLENRLEDVSMINSWGVNFIHADQGNFCDWNEMKEVVPNDFDFFIEDGSHWPNHMVVTLWQAKDLLKSGGYYFMEDLQNPVTSRGKFKYDNALLTDELLMALHTKQFNSMFLNDQQNKDIAENFELVELVLDPAKINYLAVFRKL
jgi:hypothetical protein